MGRLVLASAAVLLGATACGTTTAQRSVLPQPKFVVYATPSSSPRHAVETIWRIHVNGTHAKRLASGNDPAVSPDGRWIAFYRGSHLLVMPAQGGTAKRVSAFPARDMGYRIAPTWAPDSRHIAFRSLDGLQILDAVSHKVHVVSAGHGGFISAFRFSPDSRKIIFTTVVPSGLLCLGWGGCDSIENSYVVSARGGKLFRLRAPGPDSVDDAGFSPDSRKVVFDAGGDVYVVSARGGKPVRLTHDHRSVHPLWGKTGIAFLRHKDIWLSDATGRHVRQLTHSRADIQPAFFSADGRELIGGHSPLPSCPGGAFCPVLRLTRGGRLWAVDVRNGRTRLLQPHARDVTPLGLSRDGKTVLALRGCSLYIVDAEGTVETIPLAGGKPHVVARGPCAATWNAG